MDEEKLHSELSRRIRQVFDNYEDTGADESWLMLREKFPVKKQERNMAWLWYAAAIILLCMGLWLMPDRNKPTGHAIAVRKPVMHTNSPSVASVDTSKTGHPDKNNKTNINKHLSRIFTQNDVAKNLNENSKPANYPLQNNTLTKADSSTHSESIITQNNVAKNQADSVQHAPLPYKQNQPALVKTMPNIFNQKAIVRNKTDHPEQIDRIVTFSVYAATYVNYAKGSDNPINIGAGFTSDVRITDKLKLSTGLAIAQNRLNYTNDNLPNPAQHAATFASLATAAAESSGKPLLGDGTMQSMVRYANTLNGTKNYNASLVGLDIPVNLKYEFNPKKTDTYVAAGISSGTFINETYRSVYTYSDVSKESDTHNSFSGFDLAKTLNVSFGVGYPLGKNRLIVEPFFKYPLDGLGAQQIKFGSSGVNLKLNLQATKK